jgi:predicted nucleic acid-binding protein
MRVQGLIDTGALLALLHEDDRWHPRCVDTFRRLRIPWATSVAVLTEFFYLASRGPRSVATTWDFVRSGTIVLLPIDYADLPALDELMRRYADRPMDFADATLVHLARRESLTTVFTIDHDDFETYRIDGRRRFRIVPGR